jgi:hypothetical protein
VRVTYDLVMPDDQLEKALENALANKASGAA